MDKQTDRQTDRQTECVYLHVCMVDQNDYVGWQTISSGVDAHTVNPL